MLNIAHLLAEAETNEELKKTLTYALDKYFKKLKDEDRDDYDEAMDDIYKCLYGDHFNHHLAIKAVSEMVNADGTTGEHWSMSQVESVISQNAIKLDNYNKYDFYFVINMLYSDFYKVLGGDPNMYVKLTSAWLDDVDAPLGKAFKYYKKVIRG